MGEYIRKSAAVKRGEENQRVCDFSDEDKDILNMMEWVSSGYARRAVG